jgi:hypothetical protein
MSNKSRPLPDTSTWKPRKGTQQTLKSAFLTRCQALEIRIRHRIEYEKQMNIHNFDAGLSIEEIIREELQLILPHRYTVRAGVISDRDGYTAGDCDLVIFNDFWFPIIKPGVTKDSRRVLLPIDGVYSVFEIKQSLDERILDNAMEKLVTCHRLNRPKTYAFRSSENRDGDPCFHGLTNPLYSAIIATNLKEGVDLDDIVERFFLINRSLERLHVIRALCVLGHGTVTWAYRDEKIGQVNLASFSRDDLYLPIVPVYNKVEDAKSDSALYKFLIDLMTHLYQSILAPEDIAAHYGSKDFGIKVPKSSEISLLPDKEWLEKLNMICDSKGHEKK